MALRLKPPQNDPQDGRRFVTHFAVFAGIALNLAIAPCLKSADYTNHIDDHIKAIEGLRKFLRCSFAGHIDIDC